MIRKSEINFATVLNIPEIGIITISEVYTEPKIGSDDVAPYVYINKPNDPGFKIMRVCLYSENHVEVIYNYFGDQEDSYTMGMELEIIDFNVVWTGYDYS